MKPRESELLRILPMLAIEVSARVDEMRRRVLEPWYMGSRPMAWLCRKLDGLYAGLEDC